MIFRGKAKYMLDQSVSSFQLAIEIFNKPVISYRVQAFLVLLIWAYNKLFMSYLYTKIGDKFYYKKRWTNFYETVPVNKSIIENFGVEVDFDHRKIRDLSKLINESISYSEIDISDKEKKNIIFLKYLRDKVEHKWFKPNELEHLTFDLMWPIIYWVEVYEKLLKILVPKHRYQISGWYALQTSFFDLKQLDSLRSKLSTDFIAMKKFIWNYNNTANFKAKFLQIEVDTQWSDSDILPTIKISWKINVKEGDKQDVLVQTKRVHSWYSKVNLKFSEIKKYVLSRCDFKITHTYLYRLYYLFDLAPTKTYKSSTYWPTLDKSKISFENLNSQYLSYDATYSNFSYTEAFGRLICKLIKEHWLDKAAVKKLYVNWDKLSLRDYLD